MHLVEKGRKDILQILLDHGADAKQKYCMGRIFDVGLGDECDGWGSVVDDSVFTRSPITKSLNAFDEDSASKPQLAFANPNISNKFLD